MNREDFPLIMGSENDMADCCMGCKWKAKPDGLIYFDNAATMQKPRRVIRAVEEFYETSNANPLRGIYDLSQEATRMVNEAREKVAEFIGAFSAEEVIFTSGATEGLNMVAKWCGEFGNLLVSSGPSDGLGADDEIIVGMGEHHANLLPWGRIARETGAKLRLVKCQRDGTMDEEEFFRVLTPNTRVVAMNLVGNVMGGGNDVKRMFRVAHEKSGAICVLDAAQAVAHRRINVQELGADFMVFSGHKMGAPMGIGVLYGKRELLEKVEPVKLGGEMMEWVEVRRSETERRVDLAWEMDDGGIFVKYAKIPQRFEAGTMNVGGIIGLRAAVEYLEEVGLKKIGEYERRLTDYAMERISGDSVEIYGAENGIIALNVMGVHPQDTAEILNQEGIAVRAGWHCAQPMLEFLGIGPVVRISLCFYNTEEEVDKLVRVLSEVRGKMGMT
ncbi:MAG: cysteine desulfurase [Candidatus Saccharibacteria bacterium]|nr:cysteine desulfurase [Candidatus Saccharibacteria bacterium]